MPTAMRILIQIIAAYIGLLIAFNISLFPASLWARHVYRVHAWQPGLGAAILAVCWAAPCGIIGAVLAVWWARRWLETRD